MTARLGSSFSTELCLWSWSFTFSNIDVRELFFSFQPTASRCQWVSSPSSLFLPHLPRSSSEVARLLSTPEVEILRHVGSKVNSTSRKTPKNPFAVMCISKLFILRLSQGDNFHFYAKGGSNRCPEAFTFTGTRTVAIRQLTFSVPWSFSRYIRLLKEPFKFYWGRFCIAHIEVNDRSFKGRWLSLNCPCLVQVAAFKINNRCLYNIVASILWQWHKLTVLTLLHNSEELKQSPPWVLS